MAIRSIGAKALQQNIRNWTNRDWFNRDSAEPAESKSDDVISDQNVVSGDTVRRRRSLLQRLVVAGTLGAMVMGSGGCMMTSGICNSFSNSDCIDDFMIGYRNKAMAEKAWHCRKDQFCNERHSREFKAGFIEGYMEVASGGNGCVPAIAPNEYWGWRYQSANGQGAVNSWFQGYPQGVRAAEEDGVGNWSQVRVMGGGPMAAPPMAAPVPMTGAMIPPASSMQGDPMILHGEPGIITGPAMSGPAMSGSEAGNPFYSDDTDLVPVPMESPLDLPGRSNPSGLTDPMGLPGSGGPVEVDVIDALDSASTSRSGAIGMTLGDAVTEAAESAAATDINVDAIFGGAVSSNGDVPSSDAMPATGPAPASQTESLGDLPFSFE